MAEEAAQRQAATQFGTDGKQTGDPGAGESPGPHGMKGDAREQAARLITGTDASQRLERIAHRQTLAENPDQSEEVRQRARAERAAIDNGSPHSPAFQRPTAHTSVAELARIANDTEIGRAHV